jgi:PIN domain nuclease of toxin-antitoxin system
LIPRILLDTHVVLRWVGEPGKLSRDQRRTVEGAVARYETIAISAVSLLEIAGLEKSRRLHVDVREVFSVLQSSPLFQIVPITFEIAIEIPRLRALRDPADCAIVATALVHRLQLITSDQRIIDSKLVHVVE